MSSSVVFVIFDDIEHKSKILLSNKLIEYCLSNNLGIVFNSREVNYNAIKELNPSVYFSLADDFFSHCCDFLNTYNIDFLSENGREAFYKRFVFFDDIYKILVNFGLKKFCLMVSNQEAELDCFDVKNKGSSSYVEILYDSILEEKDVWAYGFPIIMIVTDLSQKNENNSEVCIWKK